MLAEAVVSSIIIAKIRKGKFINIKVMDFKGMYLFIAAGLIQAIFQYLHLEVEFIDHFFIYFHSLSYILIFIGLILNFEYISMKLICTGTLLNFIVILVNGGKMPVFIGDLSVGSFDIIHTAFREGTRLWFLADIILIPPPYPFPKIMSIGDLFIITGAFMFIQKLMVNEEEKYNKIHETLK